MKAKGINVINTESTNAINTIILAGFSIMLVPYKTIEAIIKIMQSEIKLPMIKVDKFSNTVVSINPANEMIKPARSIIFRGRSSMFPNVFILYLLSYGYYNIYIATKQDKNIVLFS